MRLIFYLPKFLFFFKHFSIDLIFDLLIQAFFGREELTVCLSLLYLLVSGSY